MVAGTGYSCDSIRLNTGEHRVLAFLSQCLLGERNEEGASLFVNLGKLLNCC